MTTNVFCFDFDETLANTDRLRTDLLESIRSLSKEDLATAYLEAYEATREEFGVPRIPLVLHTLSKHPAVNEDVHRQLAELFHTFPYDTYLYPGAIETIKQLKEQGKVLILSDGDAFFQPQKIYSSSVSRLVDGVIIVPNKIDFFTDLSGYWPAEKYVFIDDKQKVLDAAREYFKTKSTTILVQQGRYANSSDTSSADISVASIADVAGAYFGNNSV